ncbi:gag-pol polyprotein, partial [Tanacetum coccineum]
MSMLVKDIRSQDGKDDKDNDKGSKSRSQSMKEQAYNKDKDQEHSSLNDKSNLTDLMKESYSIQLINTAYPLLFNTVYRSSVTEVEPRRHFKSLSLDELRSPDFNLFSNQEYSEEEETEAMAEKMEQYTGKTRTDYGSGFARPKIEEKDSFELKGQFLKELRENTFSGLDNEDANEHIEKVLKIVDLFHVPNITMDQLMLRVFPISLTGAASRWLRNEPTGSIKTWEDLKTKFLNKYCPPGQTAKKMEEINNFQQEPDETLYQAWERFKELLMKCPQHYLTEMQETAADAKKAHQGINGHQFSEATLKASHTMNHTQKEKDPGSFTLPCFINNVFFDNVLVDLGASVSVMSLLTYLNLGLGELAHTKLTVELADRTVKYPKGIAKNVLWLGSKKIIFKSVKPASSLIKRVYMLSLRERMELDLEARLMGETLVLNRSLDPFLEDYIKLNDLNEPFELRRNQGDDLMPTIEEGEVIEQCNKIPPLLKRGIDAMIKLRGNGALYYLDRIWVPLKGDVRTLIIDEAHKSKYYVHPGADKMYYDLKD